MNTVLEKPFKQTAFSSPNDNKSYGYWAGVGDHSNRIADSVQFLVEDLPQIKVQQSGRSQNGSPEFKKVSNGGNVR